MTTIGRLEQLLEYGKRWSPELDDETIRAEAIALINNYRDHYLSRILPEKYAAFKAHQKAQKAAMAAKDDFAESSSTPSGEEQAEVKRIEVAATESSSKPR